MTDFTTIIVPQDRDFVPSEQDAARGRSFLEAAFPEYPVTIRTWSTPRFVTSGDDFEKYTCPRCKKLVKRYYLDDAGKHWWYTVLWDLRGEDQLVTAPCCGAEVAVREFDFGTDAAFASFALSVEGVGGLGELTKFGEDNRKKLESMLGCRTLWIVEVAT
jgi:hypothetical protein